MIDNTARTFSYNGILYTEQELKDELLLEELEFEVWMGDAE